MKPRRSFLSSISLQQPHVRAKLLGIVLVCIGIVFLLRLDELSLKIGFASVLIGLFMVFMITEKTLPRQISQAQLDGHLQTLKNITKELNLQGNAVFLPQSSLRSQERMFIPLTEKPTSIPDMDDTQVFSNGLDGHSMGISVPPTGLALLDMVQQESEVTETTLDTVEEYLQSFVGLNLLKSVALKHQGNHWSLEIEGTPRCQDNNCGQLPCPTCSAVLTAVTRAAQQPVWITNTMHQGNKTVFTLDIKT